MKSFTVRSLLAPVIAGAALFLSATASHAFVVPVYSGPYYLNITVTSTDDISNIVEFTSGADNTATGQFAISAPGGNVNNPFPFNGPSYADTVFLMGVVHSTDAHDGGLVLFTSATYAPSAIGSSFNSLYSPYDEATLAGDLITETVAGDVRLNAFATDYINTIGFTPGGALTLIAFSDGESIGAGTSVAVATTPLPAALPMFAGGIGALGLVGLRRKRKRSKA